MKCSLPYHSTPEFVRLVQICHLDNTVWAFLKPMQDSGSEMPRSVLIQRCIADQVWMAHWFASDIARVLPCLSPHLCNIVMRRCTCCFDLTDLVHAQQAVLRFICEAARPIGHRSTASSAFLAFYGVVACEVIAAAQVGCDSIDTLLISVAYECPQISISNLTKLGRLLLAAVSISTFRLRIKRACSAFFCS